MGQLADVTSPLLVDHPELLARVAAMPDPRRACGRRHPLVFVLALAACAVLADARSLTAIAEWAADAPPDLLIRLADRDRTGGTTRPTQAVDGRLSAVRPASASACRQGV
ncbi:MULTISPECIES: transposase family protein [unclassified Streptomyces]